MLWQYYGLQNLNNDPRPSSGLAVDQKLKSWSMLWQYYGLQNPQNVPRLTSRPCSGPKLTSWRHALAILWSSESPKSPKTHIKALQWTKSWHLGGMLWQYYGFENPESVPRPYSAVQDLCEKGFGGNQCKRGLAGAGMWEDLESQAWVRSELVWRHIQN